MTPSSDIVFTKQAEIILMPLTEFVKKNKLTMERDVFIPPPTPVAARTQEN